MKRVVITLALAAAAAAAACNGNVAGNAPGGPEVFAKTCVACHGPTGKPNDAMVARLGVKDLTSPDERAKLTPAFVEHQVREGSQNKLMPGFAGALTDEQITAVATYVASAAFIKH